MALNLKVFRETLRYQARLPNAQLQVELQQLAYQDTLAVQKKQKYRNWSIGCGILSFFSFFCLSVLPFFGFLFVGALGLTITFAVLSSRWGRLNVPDYRYLLPQRLAEMLSRDTASETPLDLTLDFSSSMHRSKKINTVPDPARSGWKTDYFEDPWLQITGQFLDRTSFSIVIVERHISRYGWKRGHSGKQKFKRKHTFKGIELQLVLKFPRKTYGAIALLEPDLTAAIQLPPEVQLTSLKVSESQLSVRAKIPGDCPLLLPESLQESLYQLITQLFLSAYHVLNLSKVLSKSRG